MKRVSEKGIMKINRHVFAALVEETLQAAEGKAFAASEKGKLLSSIGGGTPAAGEISDHLFVTEADGVLYLEWYIIMSFGASIKQTTKVMLDYAEQELRQMFPHMGGCVRIRIVGVKSRLIAERNIEVERQWNKA
ncbi:MAG: hypothetical protein HFE73_06065 [Firmicutes bacterium]|nr:hypothetical protein [Bacillota bacterium]